MRQHFHCYEEPSYHWLIGFFILFFLFPLHCCLQTNLHSIGCLYVCNGAEFEPKGHVIWELGCKIKKQHVRTEKALEGFEK